MENNLDKLFKSKLEGQEPEFHPAAWDRMEGLLDSAGMTPALKKKPNRTKIIYLSLLFVGIFVLGGGYLLQDSNNSFGEGSSLVDANEIKTTNIVHTENLNSTSNTNSEPTQNSNSNLTSNEINSTSSSTLTDNSPLTPSSIKTSKTKSKIKSTQDSGASPNSTLATNEIKSTLSSTLSTNEKSTVNGLENPIILIANTSSDSRFEDPIDKYNTQEIENISKSKLSRIGTSQKLNEDSAVNEKYENNNSLTQTKEDNQNVDRTKALEKNDLKTTFNNERLNSILSIVEQLDTRTAILKSPDKLIQPQIQLLKTSIYNFGVKTSARFNDGVGYTFGPYFSINIGKGYSFNFGAQYEAQNFDVGAELTVVDKIYSFGSTLKERKFSLSNQKSLSLPLSVQRSFGSFSMTTGLSINKIIATSGRISDNSEGLEPNAVIENDMIKPVTISIQGGLSYKLNRFFDLDFGVEYRPKAFKDDNAIPNNSNKFYPSIGLRYKLFNF